MLHTDIPTDDEFRLLDAVRGDICVSIYLPTTPVTRQAKADRILFKNLSTEAVNQLRAENANKRKISAIDEQLGLIYDDVTFWAYLADGLAVFVTPNQAQTFRLPMAPDQAIEVSDRFHIKPLVPLLAFPAGCFILALSQGATRLIEVTTSLAEEVKVAGLPKSMNDALKRQFPRDRRPTGRLQGSEGMKVLMNQYCRAIDRALRPVLVGRTTPLVVAAVDELSAIYRTHCSYPHLLRKSISGNPEQTSVQDLAQEGRSIALRHARAVVRQRLKLVDELVNVDLASTDLAQVANAAAKGQVETLMVDVSASQPGTIDPATGLVTIADEPGATTYDICDEIVGLTLRAGGEVLPVEAGRLPYDSPVAAIFRYRS